ncbi:MAG: hypothetical protein SA339_10115 [Methanomassiliicoccus sp.]|nr:hypothetical protein [Methanomassiliicoccus sp.]
MAEESNVHAKVAMADVAGLFLIGFFVLLVGCYGLKLMDTLDVVVAISIPVGIVALLVTLMMYLNENVLGTGIFAPLAIFFLSVGVIPTSVSGALFMVTIGIIIGVDAIVALSQPVKTLPIHLGIATIAFFATAAFYNDTSLEAARYLFGILWFVLGLYSFYMAAGIMLLVLKGKQVLPLLIKA